MPADHPRHYFLAFGLDAEIGSLSPHKAADIVAIDLSQLETQPVHQPISQIVYAAGRDQVSDVWINGRRVLKERQLVTLDPQQILGETRAWAERMAGG